MYIIKVCVCVCEALTEAGGLAATVIARAIPRKQTLEGRSSEADFVMPSKQTPAQSRSYTG